jgi:hypothetical protein
MRRKRPYLKYLDFLDCWALIALRISFASPLPTFHAALPAVLPATGTALAPTFAPILAPFVFLLAILYLHPGGVRCSKHRDTPKHSSGNSRERDLLSHLQPVRHVVDPGYRPDDVL